MMEFSEFFCDIFVPFLQNKILLRSLYNKYNKRYWTIDQAELESEWVIENRTLSGVCIDLSKVEWDKDVYFRSHHSGWKGFTCWSEPFSSSFDAEGVTFVGSFRIEIVFRYVMNRFEGYFVYDGQDREINEKFPVLNEEEMWEFEGEGKKTKSCRKL